MDSILQVKKECYVCKATYNLHRHHVYFGYNRPVSEKNGFVVYLCLYHHEGTYGVHGKNGKDLNLKLKQIFQEKYEETHSREDFIALIGQSYLDLEEEECQKNTTNGN